MSGLVSFLLIFPFFMLAVVVHEVSHGLVALRLGDSTARDAGRLTLNPFKHIDPLGTVVLPALLIAMQLPAFGWAKPVPVNAFNMRHPKRDMLWVGAAGPAANFGMALAGAGLIAFIGAGLHPLAVWVLKNTVLINLVLGTFNLLPIPPLDGSRVLTGLLPLPLARVMVSMERWGFVLLIILFYSGVLSRVIWPVVEHMEKVLGL